MNLSKLPVEILWSTKYPCISINKYCQKEVLSLNSMHFRDVLFHLKKMPSSEWLKKSLCKKMQNYSQFTGVRGQRYNASLLHRQPSQCHPRPHSAMCIQLLVLKCDGSRSAPSRWGQCALPVHP